MRRYAGKSKENARTTRFFFLALAEKRAKGALAAAVAPSQHLFRDSSFLPVPRVSGSPPSVGPAVLLRRPNVQHRPVAMFHPPDPREQVVCPHIPLHAQRLGWPALPPFIILPSAGGDAGTHSDLTRDLPSHCPGQQMEEGDAI